MNESSLAGTGYAVAMKDPKGWKIVFKGNSRDQDKEIKKLQKSGKKLGKDFKGYRTQKPIGYIFEEKENKEMKYSPQKHEWGKDASVKYAKSLTPGEKKEKKMKSFKEMREATYQGKEVPLNKPMKGDVKKSKVYVKDPKTGNVKKVNFGDKTMSIKKDQPGRKKSYCARSGGIEGGGKDKTKANYWSRKAWNC